eukprot:1157805-Pelagomonas_calceolata.AAC.17
MGMLGMSSTSPAPVQAFLSERRCDNPGGGRGYISRPQAVQHKAWGKLRGMMEGLAQRTQQCLMQHLRAQAWKANVQCASKEHSTFSGHDCTQHGKNKGTREQCTHGK